MRPSKLTIRTNKRKESEESFKEIDSTRLLRGEEQKIRFAEDFLPRKVMTSKYGVLSAFDEIGFTFPSLLRAQGLDEFMHVQQEIYPHLVKVF